MKSVEKLREDAVAIFRSGLNAADPIQAVRRAVKIRSGKLEILERLYDLAAFRNVYVVGAGKATAKMAQTIEALLSNRLTAGVINVKYHHGMPLKLVKVNEAGHPIPDEAGVLGTVEIVNLLRRSSEQDLVFCLISGGGSALLPYPAEGLTLKDKQRVTELMLKCGATIHEINAVRKHLSRIKGGRLTQIAYPATVISLILSDVVGDDLKTIASGPTVPDDSCFADCLRILDKYHLKIEVPPAVLDFIEKGVRGEVSETPKAADSIFTKTQNALVGSNLLALQAAKEQAERLGYHSMILSSTIQGENREVALIHGAIAREIFNTGNPIRRPACVISGGETTVTIRGSGLGGRNQEFSLAAALAIDGLSPVVVLSGGTDGTDGPTDAAGAISDGQTISRGTKCGLDANSYLENNDSYHFFRGLGDLLMTGATYTNVMDLRLVLVG